jgi:hypothetical protein
VDFPTLAGFAAEQRGAVPLQHVLFRSARKRGALAPQQQRSVEQWSYNTIVAEVNISAPLGLIDFNKYA